VDLKDEVKSIKQQLKLNLDNVVGNREVKMKKGVSLSLTDRERKTGKQGSNLELLKS
jgi:hypothetical protein